MDINDTFYDYSDYETDWDEKNLHAASLIDTGTTCVNSEASNLKLVALNVNGLQSKLNLGIIDVYLSSFDILCLSETYTQEPDLENSSLHDFKVFTLDNKIPELRKFGGTHGVCILVKQYLSNNVKVIENMSSNDCLWVLLDENILGFKLVIGALYVPCEGSKYFCNDAFDILESDIIELSCRYDSPVCLIGDFNARTGNVSDYLEFEENMAEVTGISENCDIVNIKESVKAQGFLTERYNMDVNVNDNGKKLIDLCQISDLKIINGRFGSDKEKGDYTCFNKNGGKSVIDYAVVSHSIFENISDFRIDPIDKCMSDVHCPVSLELSKNMPCLTNIDNVCEDDQPCAQENVQKCENLIFKWDQSKCDLFKQKLAETDISSLRVSLDALKSSPSQEGVDSLCNEFNRVLVDNAKSVDVCRAPKARLNKKMAPVRMDKPWFDEECKAKRKEYFRTKNRARRLGSADSSQDVEKKAACNYKKFIRKKANDYKKAFQSKIRVMRSNNSKEYWDLLKSAGKKRQEEGAKICLNVFMEHFKKISNSASSDSDNSFDPTLIDHSHNENINMSFTVDELLLIAAKLKNGKACGVDHIRNEFLKQCTAEMFEFMKDMFNFILDNSLIPTEWCIGMIFPLYKNKGSMNDPDNYRGITLLSCVGKFFTACLNNRITNFLESAGVLGCEQAGFRDGYSTMDHIFTLHAIIDIFLSKRKKLYCAFVDYRKAFDVIDRSYLWCKLLSAGVNGKIISAIYSMYNHAKSCVFKDGAMSNYFSCNVGVRQGENLSPILFAVYLNDFEYYVSRKYEGLKSLSDDLRDNWHDDDTELYLRLYVLLYADDTVVMAESQSELQKALNAVHNYCMEWNLTVNVDKTKIVVFSRGKLRNKPVFIYGDRELETVDSYVYLGVTFNYNGKFKVAIEKQINQARKAMFSMLSKVKKLMLPVDIQLDLFDKLVLPVLLYGCEVWGFDDLSKVELFYRKFLKSSIGVSSNTANVMTYGETGKFNIESHIQSRMSGFWCRMRNGKQCKISVIMYQLIKCMHYDNDNPYNSKWIQYMQNTYDQCGLSHIWVNEGDGFPDKYIKLALKQRINDMNLQKWQAEVYNNSQCTFYRMFKESPNLEEYNKVLSKKDVVNLTKFRCRNHKLPVAKSKIPGFTPEALKCTLCDSNELGDECHYLFKCNSFAKERKLYLGENQFVSVNIFKIQSVMNVNRINELKKLAKFIGIIISYFQNPILTRISQTVNAITVSASQNGVNNLENVVGGSTQRISMHEDVGSTSVKTRSGRVVVCPPRLDL